MGASITLAYQNTHPQDSNISRRQVIGGIAVVTWGSTLFWKQDAFAEKIQLETLRAEGLKAEALRAQAEADARVELDRRREEDELRAKQEQGNRLCVTPYGVDIVGITQTIGLTGALVAGISARNRKAEVEELNAKLRSVNESLRKQARSGITYAPTLSYAPTSVGGKDTETATATATDDSAASNGGVVQDKEIESIRAALRKGKSLLKSGTSADASNAMVQFKKALLMSRTSGNMNLERRAMRGLAATKRIKGDLKAAVQDLLEVLEISKRLNDFTGDSDALGTIADVYAEMGDLETAGKYYDLYLSELNNEITS